LDDYFIVMAIEQYALAFQYFTQMIWSGAVIASVWILAGTIFKRI